MKLELERELWRWTRSMGDTHGNVPRAWILTALEEGRLQSAKQAWATLEKWCRKGWYEYGVTLDLGWRRVDSVPLYDGHSGGSDE